MIYDFEALYNIFVGCYLISSLHMTLFIIFRDLASKFEKGLAAAAKLSDEVLSSKYQNIIGYQIMFGWFVALNFKYANWENLLATGGHVACTEREIEDVYLSMHW